MTAYPGSMTAYGMRLDLDTVYGVADMTIPPGTLPDPETTQRMVREAFDFPLKDEQAEVLESLLAHPGWQLLAQQARKEWDTRERAGRHAALNDTDDKRALDKLRQITAAQEAVEWVLGWPREEMARRKRQEQTGPATGARPAMRPVGSDQLIGTMSRRGSL